MISSRLGKGTLSQSSSIMKGMRGLIAFSLLLGMCLVPLEQGVWAKSAKKEQKEQKKQKEQKDPVVSHLEYLGYVCEVLKEGIRAKHDTKLPVLVRYYRGGIKVQTGFRGTELKKNEMSRFTTLNFLSASTRVAHLYWNQDGHLFMDAWMPGLYEKTRFSVFMEAWEEDAQNLRAYAKELKPYLIE